MPDDTFVTLEVVKSLLQSQADAFKYTFSLLIQDIKEELKSVKNDINDLKVSVQFALAEYDYIQRKCDSIGFLIMLRILMQSMITLMQQKPNLNT